MNNHDKALFTIYGGILKRMAFEIKSGNLTKRIRHLQDSEMDQEDIDDAILNLISDLAEDLPDTSILDPA